MRRNLYPQFYNCYAEKWAYSTGLLLAILCSGEVGTKYWPVGPLELEFKELTDTQACIYSLRWIRITVYHFDVRHHRSVLHGVTTWNLPCLSQLNIHHRVWLIIPTEASIFNASVTQQTELSLMFTILSGVRNSSFSFSRCRQVFRVGLNARESHISQTKFTERRFEWVIGGIGHE